MTATCSIQKFRRRGKNKTLVKILGGRQHRTTPAGQILGGRDPCGVDAYDLATVDVCKMPAFMHCIMHVGYMARQVCIQLPTSADNVALLAFADATEGRPCSKRSMSPARRANGSKPAAVAAEWWDHQKDGRTRGCYAMRAVSILVL